MKNIAVIVHSLTIEYPVNVLNGITSYFSGRDDIRLIISQVRLPHDHIGVYEYQFWTSAQLLRSKEIDGIIVISGSFSSQHNSIPEWMKIYSDKPVVSISMDYGQENVHFTRTECNTSYVEIVRHLKEKHNCKKIAFISANPTGSSEASDRYNAFLEGMEKAGLEFDDKNCLFHGMFTGNTAVESLKKTIHSKEDVKFDAMVAANDLMAIGAMTYLQSLGVNIPDDVKIIGFDNTSHGEYCSPKLSTIDQSIFKHGYEGAKFCDDLLYGRTDVREVVISTEPMYRQSCGCVLMNEYGNIYYNKDSVLCSKENDIMKYSKTNGQYLSFLACINDINSVIDMVRSADTLQQFYYSYKYIMQSAKLDASIVCFYPKPEKASRENPLKLPAKMSVAMAIDLEKGNGEFEPDKSFNPKKTLMINDYFPDRGGLFMLNPVFAGEVNYGYVINKIKDVPLAMYSTLFKILNNSLSQAYEYTTALYEKNKLSSENKMLQKSNDTLDIQSKTDELTQLLNRRGFMELGQRTIELAVTTEQSGLVFFADMDGLKKINDNYGHDMGDKAIKAQAEVLMSIFRTNDLVGRLSGDEFAAIAIGMNLGQLSIVRHRIDEMNHKKTLEYNLPFELSCSIGAVLFERDKYSLKELLRSADEKLYEEKKRKKCRSAQKSAE